MEWFWFFDLDDTLLDNTHRKHYLTARSTPDWDGFHQTHELMKDTPRSWTQGLWSNSSFQYGRYGFLTARDERASLGTRLCLSHHGLLAGADVLLLKPVSPERGIYFKIRTLLSRLSSHADDVIIMVEDKPDIVSALRALQHPRLHVIDANVPDSTLRTAVDMMGNYGSL